MTPNIQDMKYKENIRKVSKEKHFKPFKRSLPSIKFLIMMLEVSGVITLNDFTPRPYIQTIKYVGTIKMFSRKEMPLLKNLFWEQEKEGEWQGGGKTKQKYPDLDNSRSLQEGRFRKILEWNRIGNSLWY